jgi:hypothetical protein
MNSEYISAKCKVGTWRFTLHLFIYVRFVTYSNIGLAQNYDACPESKDASSVVGKFVMLIMATLPSTLILYL